jgi:hypothetical protein
MAGIGPLHRVHRQHPEGVGALLREIPVDLGHNYFIPFFIAHKDSNDTIYLPILQTIKTLKKGGIAPHKTAGLSPGGELY